MTEHNCPILSYESYLCETPCSDGCPYEEGRLHGNVEARNLFNEFIDRARAKIDFEEKWLDDVYREDGHISPVNVGIAMDAIRHLLKEDAK